MKNSLNSTTVVSDTHDWKELDLNVNVESIVGEGKNGTREVLERNTIIKGLTDYPSEIDGISGLDCVGHDIKRNICESDIKALHNIAETAKGFAEDGEYNGLSDAEIFEKLTNDYLYSMEELNASFIRDKKDDTLDEYLDKFKEIAGINIGNDELILELFDINKLLKADILEKYGINDGNLDILPELKSYIENLLSHKYSPINNRYILIENAKKIVDSDNEQFLISESIKAYLFGGKNIKTPVNYTNLDEEDICFIDWDGTLFVDGKFMLDILDIIRKDSDEGTIKIWTGGQDIEKIKEVLLINNINDIPVVRKQGYYGKIIDFVVDDECSEVLEKRYGFKITQSLIAGPRPNNI